MFKRTGTPPSLVEVAKETGSTEAQVVAQLEKQDKLDQLLGLSLAEAFELLQFYGRDAIFTESIADAVSQTVETKQKIRSIEGRKRGPGKE